MNTFYLGENRDFEVKDLNGIYQVLRVKRFIVLRNRLRNQLKVEGFYLQNSEVVWFLGSCKDKCWVLCELVSILIIQLC